MEREALKLALEALESIAMIGVGEGEVCEYLAKRARQALASVDEALAQPAQNEWNAALDEAAARIGEIKGFGQATQDSFAVFIKGLKK